MPAREPDAERTASEREWLRIHAYLQHVTMSHGKIGQLAMWPRAVATFDPKAK